MENLLASVINLDKMLLYKINRGMGFSALDAAMLFLSSPFPWVLLVVAIIYWGVSRKVWQMGKVILLIVTLVSLTDILAYRVFKPSFARYRPCIELIGVRMVDACGGEFGFPSNHAANAMAITFFLHLYFRKKGLTAILLLFTLLVGISRIYLGAHYPLDVFFGYLLGLLVAWIVYHLSIKYGKHIKIKFSNNL
jgi:undecaprenyl-diphosphatase